MIMLERIMLHSALGRVMAIVMIAASGAALAQSSPNSGRLPEDNFELAAPSLPEKPLQIWATWYRVYQTKETADGHPLLDMDGREISPPVSEKAFCLGAIEGSMRITDAGGKSRTYNF